MGEQEEDKEEEEEEEEEEKEEDEIKKFSAGYNYLLSMALWSLTLEKVEALKKEKEAKEKELDDLMKKSPEDLWNIDLENFLVELDQFYKDMAAAEKADEALKKKNDRKRKEKKKIKKEEDEWVPG